MSTPDRSDPFYYDRTEGAPSVVFTHEDIGHEVVRIYHMLGRPLPVGGSLPPYLQAIQEQDLERIEQLKSKNK